MATRRKGAAAPAKEPEQDFLDMTAPPSPEEQAEAPPPAEAKAANNAKAAKPAKPKTVVESHISPDLREVSLTITIGDKQFMLEFHPLTVEQKIRAALHGIERKIVTARHPEAVLEQIMVGQWPSGRTVGARRVPLIIQAVSRLHGIPVEAAEKRWKAFDNGTKAVVRGDPRIKSAMAAIKAEQEQSTVDVAALFQNGG